jgi:RNA polymerase-binding transcription factor DksA
MKNSNVRYDIFERILRTRKRELAKIAESLESPEAWRVNAVVNGRETITNADLVSESADRDVSERLNLRARHELCEIDQALIRIESKTYGVCAVCEERIELPRLLAAPTARECVRCTLSDARASQRSS